MSGGDGTLIAARDAYRRHRWDEARDGFRHARAGGELAADDALALADSAWWLGQVDESIEAGEAAYRLHVAAGETCGAASAAVQVAVNHLLRGEELEGSGWMGRAMELLADVPDSREAAYLRYFTQVSVPHAPDGPARADGAREDGVAEAVIATARAVADDGHRLGDPGLVAAGTLGEGRALVKQGRVAEGMVLLDRAMLIVLDGHVTPDLAGNLYCHMIDACHELADVRRAAHWTAALERWLATLPAAVVFTGICRVHRSQILQVAGDWDRAERVAVQVCAELDAVMLAPAAEGHYQVGEINRLRGRFAAAEEEYGRAHRLGRDPQPGLALLRLTQGRVPAAAAAVRAALLAETGDRLVRARLCAAQVEIALAAGDPATARAAAAELAETAAAFSSPGLAADAARATGAVLLAEGDAARALAGLRDACRRCVELGAPYECARARLLLADAYAALGDAEAAARELDAADATFAELGAVTDRAAAAARRGAATPGGLTDRESEVLACLAAGRSNREIGTTLVISEKTVARHLSNIFAKLGVTSRTAATAYAFEHGLVPAERG